MSHKVHYSLCPVCSSSSVSKIIRAKDHTVSGEEFQIFECADCTLRFTQDVPDNLGIGRYYKSENYISHSNTSKGLVNTIYQAVRKRALVQKRKLIESATGVRKGHLLDVGSGTGSFAATMKNAGWNVMALEPDEQARTVGLRDHHISIESSDRFNHLPSDTYDAITLWHVLEHVHDLQGYIRQFRKLLRSTGKLFVAVPNYTSFDAMVYGENWAAYDVPRHLYHFNPRSMQRLMKLGELKVIKVMPMWYDSFYVSLLSSRYKKGKTNWLSALWTGMLSNLKAMENKERCSSLIYIIEKLG